MEKFEKTDDMALSINITSLPEAQEIKKDATTYIVWMASKAKEIFYPINVGALNYTKNSIASLKTIVSEPDVEIFITPEKNSTAPLPTGPVVFKKKVN